MAGAATPRHHLRGLLQRAGLAATGTGLAAAVLVGVAAGGNTVVTRQLVSDAAVGAPAGGWTPSGTTSPGAGVVVAVLLGRSGTVASDALAPFEVFARSSAFSVYTVAGSRDPAPLTGGTSLVPTHTFSDVRAGRAPRPDVLVVPAVEDPTGVREQAARSFITAQATAGVDVLGVCSGSELLAATGVLDGRRATSHWSSLDALRTRHPAVHWVEGQRWVEDRGVTTTAAVSSGVPGALQLVRRLAGADEAARVGAQLRYPGWRPGGSPRIAAQRLALSDLPIGLNAVLPWLRPTVAVALADGVSEIDAAAVLEAYATSGTARTLAVAATPTVTTRHGLVLTATATGSAPSGIDRVVAPGVPPGGVDPAVERWARARGLPLDVVGSRGTGGFDAALTHLAQRSGGTTALSVAKMVDYPAAHLGLGVGVDARAFVLAALTLVVAAGAGALPTAVRRLRRPT